MISGEKKIIGIVIFLLISVTAWSQRQLHGIVIDSASFAPLANVNVSLKNSSRGTSTDGKGEFRILVNEKDTLIFSLVGYLSSEFKAYELEATSLIRLTEEVRILQTMNFTSKPEENKGRTIRLAPSGKLMNYGPTGAGVNFAYFGKQEREKRKLNKVLHENDRVKNYVSVVTSPEVRERIIYDYSLSEDEYYQILASFNIENGNSLYELTAAELIVVMNNYFKRYAHKK